MPKKSPGSIEAQSARAGVPVAVSIIDVHGNIILKHRMNGAPVFAADLSERKAYTSALVGLRTADLDSARAARTVPLRPDGAYPADGIVRWAAERRLPSTGQLVAGVGVSGGTVEQDVDILELALREAAAPSTTEMKLEVVVIPVADVGSRQTLLWRPRLAAGHRLRIGRRLPGDPVHAARLRMLDHLRQERHDGCARLGEGLAPDRVRHRGCPSRHC